MLYSRVQLVNDLSSARYMNAAVLQDTYDINDDVEELPEVDNHSNAPSIDNYYDAQGIREPIPGQERERSVGPTSTSLPEVRINLDPTEKLIDAMEALREVILDNTNAQQKQRRRGRGGGGGGGGGGAGHTYKANGTPLNVKDERLKIRRDKVSADNIILIIHSYTNILPIIMYLCSSNGAMSQCVDKNICGLFITNIYNFGTS